MKENSVNVVNLIVQIWVSLNPQMAVSSYSG